MEQKPSYNPLALLSISRPVFITCVVVLSLVVGLISLTKVPVNLFPDVNFPIVFVQTMYPGAGPKEVEMNISKKIEEELANLVGLKNLRSESREGVSIVVCEFNLSTDIKYAEQQIRDRMSSIKSKLPRDVDEPIIRKIDPADMPVAAIAVNTELAGPEVYDLIDQQIRSKFEQVEGVGKVEVLGVRKREIKVELNQDKLKLAEISAGQVVARLAQTGLNIPAGKRTNNLGVDDIYRTVGEFHTVQDIGKVVVSFYGNDVPVTINDLGKVVDSLEDETTRAYHNGKKTAVLNIYKRSGANTISVVSTLKKEIEKLNAALLLRKIPAQVNMVRDGSQEIKDNVDDVKESILLGILLTIIVVYFFLKNFRSTFITGLALPNSLLGAFILIAFAGFTMNVMTLLALSLSVGLLIDDAIVVRENIFRHLEMGKDPKSASLIGTTEVTLAVLATTLSVLAVFGPIAFLDGIVGQFFKEFGLTICFVMIISTFDALTIAPMLSTYFAGKISHVKEVVVESKWTLYYKKLLQFTVKKPLLILSLSALLFVVSMYAVGFVPKTFLPEQDQGEFTVSLELSPGASLSLMDEKARAVQQVLVKHEFIKDVLLTVGDITKGEQYADIYVRLVSAKKRSLNTSQVKDLIRQELKAFKEVNPIVKDYDPIGGGDRPFVLAILGEDQKILEDIAQKMSAKLKEQGGLLDIDVDKSLGRPEVQFIPLAHEAEKLGVSVAQLGQELRILLEGQKASVYRERGTEYDIRVRLQEDQRSLKERFLKTYTPNINYSLIPLSKVASMVESTGQSAISRKNRAPSISIGADVNGDGPGLGAVVDLVKKSFESDLKLPPGYGYQFLGQTESFQEMIPNMLKAMLLAVLFIYVVLASLYESFVIPLTIMLVLPLAICGAIFALLITGHSLDIFSMIGCILLMGVATKNSIILVDYANQLVLKGISLNEAILEAGLKRVRPILMTSFALIAGMLPVAYGLNEASKQRMSMGIAVIGGVISSTFLTLLVVPAAYSYMERFRRYCAEKVSLWIK